MPTLVPAINDERDGLLTFLAAQRAALRRATHGLTDEQLTATPSASALSLAGLIKHLTQVERNWIDLLTGHFRPEVIGQAGFDLDDDETTADLLAEYDSVARHTESALTNITDLGETHDLTVVNDHLPESAPRLPEGTTRSARWILLHLIEETARHAGHADIIRESLDGATAIELVTASGDSLLG